MTRPPGARDDIQMNHELLVDSINRDLRDISEWRISNVVNFNHNKTASF